ncbi:MAG: diacylglycerol kinase family protein [Flexilinea sp.]|nr:diacylglycerol kinase family protein [Flexilinea sp.]
MISEFFRGRIRAFTFAWAGLRNLWLKEKNTRVYLFFTVAVIIAGFVFTVSITEWCILIMLIAAVWCAEALNAAVERNVDLVTAEKKPLAKEAKDLAAGAVLILAIASAVIGLMIFLPKFISLFLY